MTGAPKDRPNVILVVTDDQGYGDLGCTGNPWMRTPHVDTFHDEAVRLTDFHVSPLCTPTRGALMTGHRPVRNGAWATTFGRSMLRSDEVTMADVFRANGYRTGMFGKWHLGDNYPYRPQDRGFEEVLWHKGGGVGQTPDFWGNNYFDDTYFHHAEPTARDGYCTDVWFREALRFVETHRDEPFFCYLATNAPHAPYLVADRYSRPYEEIPEIPQPDFYGMIANIDENFARLRRNLREWGIEDDTILIFMTDNGSSGGCELDEEEFVQAGYNAGMRGKKGSYYEGGHRVPCFIRWPEGGVAGGRDVDEMSLHVDILPTLIELCALEPPEGVAFDGTSLGPLLRGDRQSLPGQRVHTVQIHQGTDPPEMWRNTVMDRRWRLVSGGELYDVEADPGQREDVAEQHPDTVARLREAHQRWWDQVEGGLSDYCPISIGADEENPTRLDALDVHGDVAWCQVQIVVASRSSGRWAVKVEQPGTYRFRLRRWPAELDLPIEEPAPPEEADRVAPYFQVWQRGTIEPVEATLGIFGREVSRPVRKGDHEASFEIELDRTGETMLDAWFVERDGGRRGAYYVYVERL